MSDIRHRPHSTPYIPVLALALVATLAGCQSPTVHEVHRLALDTLPPPYAAVEEHQLGAWRLADAAHQMQRRARARNAQGVAGSTGRDLHAGTDAVHAVHPIAGTVAIDPARTAPSSSERLMIAAR